MDGDLEAVCDKIVSGYSFDLGIFDIEGGRTHYAEEVFSRRQNIKGRWNFRVWEDEEMTVMLGEVRGLRANWVNVSWEDS